MPAESPSAERDGFATLSGMLKARAAAQLSVEEITAWLESRLSHYKIPSLWVFLPRLPRTATGKMDRKTLHALART